MFYLFSKMLSVNEDFRLVADEREEESLEIIEEETGKKPECCLFDELSEESIALLKEVMDIEIHDKKVTKKHAVDLMSRAFSNDVLFEGMCLASFIEDDALSGVMESYGCPNRHELLNQDKVYLKRKQYMRRICDYTLAAVNLYGAIHLKELMVIMESFEKWPSSGKEYKKCCGKNK